MVVVIAVGYNSKTVWGEGCRHEVIHIGEGKGERGREGEMPN